MFSWVHGSAWFQMTYDAVIHIMAKEKCQTFAYIDDFILVSQEADADHHFDKLSALFTALGLPMNIDKRSQPTRSLTCLGITIDLDNNSLSIDKDKLEEIYTCNKVRSKHTISRKKFQSLLGKLIYLHKCIVPARIFINRILALYRENAPSKRH